MMNDLSDKSVAEFADDLADEALDRRQAPSGSVTGLFTGG